MPFIKIERADFTERDNLEEKLDRELAKLIEDAEKKELEASRQQTEGISSQTNGHGNKQDEAQRAVQQVFDFQASLQKRVQEKTNEAVDALLRRMGDAGWRLANVIAGIDKATKTHFQLFIFAEHKRPCEHLRIPAEQIYEETDDLQAMLIQTLVGIVNPTMGLEGKEEKLGHQRAAIAHFHEQAMKRHFVALKHRGLEFAASIQGFTIFVRDKT